MALLVHRRRNVTSNVVIVMALFALPCTAAAQTWVDAVGRGEYETAAAILHSLVTDQQRRMLFDDPAPPRQLAIMYAEGLGVERDPVTACTLAQVARMASHYAGGRYAEDVRAHAALVKEIQQFARDRCDVLSPDDQRAATHAIGCPAFGMRETEFAVGGHAVQVGRTGIRLTSQADSAVDFGCPQLVARVGPRTVPPPAGAATGVEARHFLESLVWVPHGADEAPGYALEWRMYEIEASGPRLALIEVLEATPRWPQPALPPDLDARLTIEMIRSGHVRWRLDGAPPRRGWIMLPER